MAYTKQTWLDRVGTFLNRFTKTNETLSSVELVNNPGTITQAGTAFSASRMNYMESGIEAAHRIATPLSDLSRVMQLNGDGVPMFPDNVAGRTYWQDDWATTDGWVPSGCTIAVADGKLNITTTTTDAYIAKTGLSFSGAINRLIRISVESKQLISVQGDLYYSTSGHGFSASYHRFFTIPKGKNYIDLDMGTLTDGGTDWITNTITEIRFDWGANTGDYYEIDKIYIGSGLFDTPVYGKDGQTVAVNHGVVPVNGKRGKALLFQGAQYLEIPDKLGTSGVIAFKYKRKTIGVNEHICSCENFTSHKGVGVYVSDGQQLVFIYGNGTADTAHPVISDISEGEEHSYVVNYTETTVGPVYRDGVLVYSQTALSGSILVSDTPTYIGRPSWGMSDMLNGQLNDILVRSTPMTQDDAIRYHNGDDAVDSQQKSVTGTPHAIAVFGANGKLNATAIEADHATTADSATTAGEVGGIQRKYIAIGSWDMIEIDSKVVPHGITGQSGAEALKKIVNYEVIILNDNRNTSMKLDVCGDSACNQTSIAMSRIGGGLFDFADYSITTHNRGYIVIDYINTPPL